MKQEKEMIIEFFKDLGAKVCQGQGYCEFVMKTQAEIDEVVYMEEMTFEALDKFLNTRNTEYCDEVILSLMENYEFRRRFTLKRVVEDLYGFWFKLKGEWATYKAEAQN